MADTITMPTDDNDIIELLDSMFNGSCYEHFFPDETEEMEWTQTDVDDFDAYRVNYQDMMDEESFYERMLDSIHDNYEPGDIVDEDGFNAFVERLGEDMYHNAEENFNPEEAGCQLIWKGSHGHSYYY